MIPYFRFEEILLLAEPISVLGLSIGPVGIQPWGLVVAAGFVLGGMHCQGIARRRGMDPSAFADLVFWLAVGGIGFGHIGYALFYEPGPYLRRPWELLYFWQGLSSFGGIFGCIVVATLFFRWRGDNILRSADILMMGLSFGWGIGRLGCFVVHDHIGCRIEEVPAGVRAAIGWLAVRFPTRAEYLLARETDPTQYAALEPALLGTVRFDLGLMDSLLGFSIAGILWVIAKRPRREGLLLALCPLLYAPVRFGLDFLRNDDLSLQDARYSGLTPAQYGCCVLFVLGLLVLQRARTREVWPSPARPA